MKIPRFFVSTVVTILGLTAGISAQASMRPDTKGLSKEQAERRVALVSDVHYKLHFNLDAVAKDFIGQVEARFTLAKANEPLTFDFTGGQIEKIDVNGTKVGDAIYNGKFVALPGQAFKAGVNTVTIHFSHPYSTTGKGLYRFKDPEDGKLYLYTDFEPYDANLLFPSFDQPDLRATYTLTVDAPSSWTVISSTRETVASPRDSALKHWEFPESKSFSTYLFSLHAGEYKVWESRAGDIPLRLFARQSMAQYVDADFWFKITQQGLGFYQSYFDFAYPFGKFDQIIVPDFNAGAMENVAAITYSERYVPRGASTRTDRINRSGVILHEMAHQWFGDLVTMRWWNDLWLNESFATYMSSLAQADATEFKEAWLDFFGEKAWAYTEDQLVTTHPIEGIVPDTEQAFANFDGITYGKGASVLKQLNLFLGPDTFRSGVRSYFKKYQFGNATLKDFIGSLAETSGQNLTGWTEEWLRTTGVNGLAAVFTCADDKIKTFALNQRPSEDADQTLRSHRTRIGLYQEDAGGSIVLTKDLTVAYSGAATAVPELVGQTCPAMVFPNHEDYDYAKVKLDSASLAIAKTKLSKISDPHLRLMVWHSLWEMVRDGELPAPEFADTILSQAPAEKELLVLTSVMHDLYGRRRSNPNLIGYLPTEGQAAPYRKAFLEKASRLFAEKVASAVPGSDLQKLWYDSYVRLGEYPESKSNLEELLADKKQYKGLQIDQDRRWVVIYELSAAGAKNADKLRVAELKRDPTASGQIASIEAEAAVPTTAAKDHWYAEIIDPASKRSFAQIKTALRGMFPTSQRALRSQFATRYFDDLVKAAQKRDNDFIGAFASNLPPATCAEDSVKRLSTFISGHQSLPPVALKALKIAHQEDQRCVTIHAVATKAWQNSRI